MKIVVISDTHNQVAPGVSHFRFPPIPSLELPDADVLVHCGDHTIMGSASQWEKAADFLGTYRGQFSHIVTIPGNHDFYTQKNERQARRTMESRGVTYLRDEEALLDGVKFYGSPWQPWFHDWAWNFTRDRFERDGLQARRIWSAIPDDTRVLITHGPPRGILDLEMNGERCGCPFLRERIAKLPRLSVHAFGHIHEQNGTHIEDGVQYVNGAICNRRDYQPVQPFQTVEV